MYDGEPKALWIYVCIYSTTILPLFQETILEYMARKDPVFGNIHTMFQLRCEIKGNFGENLFFKDSSVYFGQKINMKI